MNRGSRNRLQWVGVATALAWSLVGAGSSSAALIGSSLTFPLIVFDNQGVLTYDAASDLLSIESDPLSIRLSAADPPANIDPTGTPADEYIRIAIEVDATGALIGGVPGDDLVVFGEVTLNGSTFSGVLLTGEVTAFGYEDSGGTTDFFDFLFTPTGGSLAAAGAPYDGAESLYVQVESAMSDFVGDFRFDFAGESKGTLGVEVPEPAAGLLLGGGVLALVVRRRRRA